MRYYCKICDYGCMRKFCWSQHTLTAKHMNANKSLTHAKREYACPNCNAKFMHQSSCSRHKKICMTKNENKAKPDPPFVITEELFLMIVKQNADMMELLKAGTHNTNNNHSHNTNCHNKAFNLNFFLNETCKDAMNITDFVESIKVQLNDLERFGDVGYVEGLSSIITANLKEMDVTERPVHCTDKKRETIYIKDQDKWEKEDEKKTKLRKAIKRIAAKNYKLLPAYREKYPGCQFASSKFSDKYNKMMVEVMGGAGDNEWEKEDKIIHNISRNVMVDK